MGAGLEDDRKSHDHKSHDHQPHEMTVRLLKDNLHGLGINIVDSADPESLRGVASSSRIVIESIVKGGPADSNGKLQRGIAGCFPCNSYVRLVHFMAGDIVVSVNSQSLEGLSRQQASALIKNSPDIVDLEILRGIPVT